MTTPAPWTPINDFDNFDPPALADPDPSINFPPYVLSGMEPAATGIPADNPNVPAFKLGRIISQGSTPGTFMVRTYEGWLVDQLFPHFSYSIGDFLLLLTCGTWCVDIGQRSYLPPNPPVPTYTAPTTTTP